jgi:hypothetical protein
MKTKTKTNKESLEMIQTIKQFLRYEDGKLYWKVARGRGVKAGDRAGSLRHDGYRQVKVMGTYYAEHRVIWGLVHSEFPSLCIDHKNGNVADNRIENLRDVSFSENQRAFRKNTHGASSVFRGVYWYRRDNKFYAQISLNGVNTYLGSFDCEIEAAKAYDRAAIKHGFDVQALNFKPYYGEQK